MVAVECPDSDDEESADEICRLVVADEGDEDGKAESVETACEIVSVETCVEVAIAVGVSLVSAMDIEDVDAITVGSVDVKVEVSEATAETAADAVVVAAVEEAAAELAEAPVPRGGFCRYCRAASTLKADANDRIVDRGKIRRMVLLTQDGVEWWLIGGNVTLEQREIAGCSD